MTNEQSIKQLRLEVADTIERAPQEKKEALRSFLSGYLAAMEQQAEKEG